MDLENIIMELIVNSGEARSTAIEAFRKAGKGNFKEAEEKIITANEMINKVHQIQTSLIQEELNGGKVETSLLMVHAQDHVMNAMTVLDLVKEMIEIMKK